MHKFISNLTKKGNYKYVEKYKYNYETFRYGLDEKIYYYWRRTLYLNEIKVGILDYQIINPKTAEIIFITATEYKKQGIGTKMIKDFEQYLINRNFNEIRLGSLYSAVGFYLKMGYENYDPNGLQFRKNLTN